MDVSTPSMRSSISPIPARQTNFGHLQNDSKMVQNQAAQNQGLGLYGGYRIPDSLGDHEESMPPLASRTAANFSTRDIITRKPSQPFPNILSAEYDPFAPHHPDMISSYGAGLFSTRTTEPSLPPISPSLSGAQSHRSSFSSAPTSETYSRPESYHVFHPQANMEGHLDWPSETNSCLMITTAPQANCPIMTTSGPCYPDCLEDTFFHRPGTEGWPTVEALCASGFSSTTGRTALSNPVRHQISGPKKLFEGVARTRTPRKVTTRDDANYQCKVKGCGKLFSRSYNFKAHLETHDASRVYPFPCPLPDCSKKFVRKTDLQRHHQSVHMKERNYQCGYCSRYFARKDTLRRHMEDGCSKRFDLAIRFNQYPNASQTEKSNDTRLTPLQPRDTSDFMSYTSATTAQPSTSLHANYSGTVDAFSSGNSQGPLWSI